MFKYYKARNRFDQIPPFIKPGKYDDDEEL